MNLRQLQSDPLAFRLRLLIDVGGSSCRWPDVVNDWQAQDFARLDRSWRAVVGNGSAPVRAWLERPRGHSKTTDIAVMVAWALFAARWPLSGIIAAADQDQARLLRDAVAGLLRVNPWLADILEVFTDKIVNRHTGSIARVITSDAPTSYGLTPDFVVADEVTHWGDKPDLWHSLLSSAAKRDRCLLVCISNAGWGDTWQWQTREAIRTDPAWIFSRLDAPVASWISPELLDEQRRLLPPIVYQRLWLNQWTSGSGDALREDDIAAAITLPGPANGPERGWVYVSGLDLGLARDASAFAVVGRHVGYSEAVPPPPKPKSHYQEVFEDLGLWDEVPADQYDEWETIAHPGTDRLRLVQLHVWRPSAGGRDKIDLGRVENEVSSLSRQFGCPIGCDPWQAAYMLQRLQATGLPAQSVDFTGSNLKAMAAAMLAAFAERTIELFPDPQLLKDLRALKVVERSYGVRLESPRGPDGHGDAATALAIALFLARKAGRYGTLSNGRTLLTYP